jgi:hypothetical protein
LFRPRLGILSIEEEDVRRIVTFALVLGALGLVVGYFIFGEIAGQYVAVDTLLGLGDDLISRIGEAVVEISDVRRNILISGAVGVGIGILAGALVSRR